jgi:2-polyprenyl-6-methoxyphenol hydroxylase-like FAD-dependent oxidoreductase
MANEYLEPQRTIPVYGSFDVAVAGGGIAGVAAAVAAARNGASVCLIEKEYALGGLATIGLVIVYLPICDGRGTKICGGLAEELLLLSAAEGAGEVPACWRPDGDPAEREKRRYYLEYNAASYILALEQLVLDHNVKLLYDTRCAGVQTSDDGEVTALVVENKSGRSAIECRAVVDATGDADICAYAGEETKSLATNSASGWYYSLVDGSPHLHKLHEPFDPAGAVVMPGAARGFAGDDADEVTDHVIASRNLIRHHQAELRAEHPDSAVLPFLIPTFPGFRMTRRLVGEVEMDADDRREYPDSIGLIPDWRRRGPVYSIPLRAIQGRQAKNLFAAGRCVSSVGHGWDMTRVIPPCVVTGEAAGTGGAMIAREGELEIEALQDRLRRQGNPLFLNELG